MPPGCWLCCGSLLKLKRVSERSWSSWSQLTKDLEETADQGLLSFPFHPAEHGAHLPSPKKML